MAQRRVEFDGRFRGGWAKHHMRKTCLPQSFDDLAGRFATLSQARSPPVGQFHRVVARDIKTPVVLANQSGVPGQVASRPLSDGERRLAPAKKFIGRFPSQQHG